MLSRRQIQSWLTLGCVLIATTAEAQEVVHALTGTVVSIETKAKTITLNTDDGSEGLFKLPTKSDERLDFDKNVKRGTVGAAVFTKIKAQVLMYYIGYGDVRTAIAIQDLGDAKLIKTHGNITTIDGHQHQFTVKDASGASSSFRIDEKTIAEGSVGVQEGKKFDLQRGEKVRVVATASNGTNTALFFRTD